jgi:cell division protein FtsB
MAFLQHMRNSIWFKRLTNRFVLTGLVFAIWMAFIDDNSLLLHRVLNREIAETEEGIQYYQGEITRDSSQIAELQSSSEKLEKFVREQYWMARPNEDIYLIEWKEE